MSDLNIIDTSQKLFSINKSELVFEITSNSSSNITESNVNSSTVSHYRINLGETSIIVTNLSSEYLSLRTMTTKKKNYSVYPSYIILPPNENKKLEVKYFVNFGEKVSNLGHKFKFEGFIIKSEEKNQDARTLFNEYISKKIPVKAYIIRASVKFIENYEKNSELDSNSNGNLLKNKINESNNNSKNKTNNFESLNNNNIIKNIDNNNNNTIDILKEEYNINNEIIEKEKKIDKDKYKDKEKSNEENIILKESYYNNNNNIRISEKEEENDKMTNKIENNNIEDKISDLNLINIQSSKTIQLNSNTNKPLIDKPEPQNTNKIKHDKISFNNFGTPIKKRDTITNKKIEEYSNPKTEEENSALLNNLKVEYYKLKNELDNLIERYNNLKNHVDLEEDNKEINDEEENIKNNKYSQNKKKEIKLSQNICFALCLFAVLLGFYLS